MVMNYNASEADRFWTEPPEGNICEETGRDNCYQCPEKMCSYWAEANEDFHEDITSLIAEAVMRRNSNTADAMYKKAIGY